MLTTARRVLLFGGEGYDWYVDSVNGNDSYSGRSSGTAFATIAKLLTVLVAGESVGLARGSAWREKFTSPGNNVEVSAYGLGTAPLLDCSVVAANASFTKTGGQTNVYQIDVTVDYIQGDDFNSVWEDNVRLVRASSLANCDATQGSYYPSSDDTTTPTLYVHASDSSSVITNGKVYEYSRWSNGVVSYGYTGFVIDGIRSRRALGASGNFRIGNSSSLYNCQSDEGNKHNVYIGDGCYLSNVSCSKAYYDPASPSKSYFVYNADNPTGLGVTFNHCSVDNDGVYDNNAGAFYGHINISGSFGVITYNDCWGDDVGIVFSGTGATTIQINNPATSSNVTCIVKAQNNCIVTGGNFSGPLAGTIKRPVWIEANDITLTLNGIRFLETLDPTGDAQIFIAGTGCTLNLNDCIFDPTYPASSANEWVLNCYVTATVNASGNDYNQNGHANGMYVYYAPNGITLTSDYNTFHGNTKEFFKIGAPLYLTVTDYQIGTGQDANSTIIG